MLELLECARGGMRWEVRRLMVRRKALLEDLKVIMTVLTAMGDEGKGVVDDVTVCSNNEFKDGELEALMKRVTQMRDSLGELSIKISQVCCGDLGKAGGGEDGEENLQSAYNSALALVNSLSLAEQRVEESEAREMASARCGPLGGTRLCPTKLLPAYISDLIGSLGDACNQIHAQAKGAAKEKRRFLEAHFAATTTMSELSKLPEWMRSTVASTGVVVSAELKSIEICREDGTPL